MGHDIMNTIRAPPPQHFQELQTVVAVPFLGNRTADLLLKSFQQVSNPLGVDPDANFRAFSPISYQEAADTLKVPEKDAVKYMTTKAEKPKPSAMLRTVVVLERKQEALRAALAPPFHPQLSKSYFVLSLVTSLLC